jgi:uncharacterized protein (DUF1684 family)
VQTMIRKNMFLGLCPALLGLLLVLQGCSQSPDRSAHIQYIKAVEAGRAMKDRQLRSGRSSPLTAGQRRDFRQLSYFPVDPGYRVAARFVANSEPYLFAIQTSTGEERVYVRVGRLEFQLGGQDLTLMTYQSQDEVRMKGKGGHLFVPFTDKTSGSDSYGGGRYLDIAWPEGETTIVDFNLAYNPYCAYNHNYSCPIPPRENSLPVEILAGEKTFRQDP